MLILEYHMRQGKNASTEYLQAKLTLQPEFLGDVTLGKPVRHDLLDYHYFFAPLLAITGLLRNLGQ